MRGGIARGLGVALVTVFAVACGGSGLMNVPFVVSIDVADTQQGIVDIKDMTGAGWNTTTHCSVAGGFGGLLAFILPSGVFLSSSLFLVVDTGNDRIVEVFSCTSIGSAGSGIGQFIRPLLLLALSSLLIRDASFDHTHQSMTMASDD